MDRLLDTPADFAAGAAALAAGRGPVAVDTERASGFRCNDRVFLLQVRRQDTGTLLFAPEGHREALTAALAPVLNELDWIVHAAVTDLNPLSWLGLHPRSLFDTELAGRLAGFEKVNIAALLEATLGVHLAKGHGREDWSTTPLPAEWLDYAADDVAYLIPLAGYLAEVLDARGLLDAAAEEFDHILATHRQSAPVRHWRAVKGIGRLRAPRQLAVARHLWHSREDYACETDRNPATLLPDKAIVALAKAGDPDVSAVLSAAPLSPAQQRRARRHLPRWSAAVTEALQLSEEHLPPPESGGAGIPPHSRWKDTHPHAAEALTAVRAGIAELSAATGIPEENLAAPKVVRRAVWEAAETGAVHSPEGLRDFLAAHGVRPWQRDAVAPVLGSVFFA